MFSFNNRYSVKFFYNIILNNRYSINIFYNIILNTRAAGVFIAGEF